MISLEAYRAEVGSAIISRHDQPLVISSTEQAAVVVEQAFLHARNRIRILCYNLNPTCYGIEPVQNAAQFFLAKCNTRADFLVESELWDLDSTYDWFKHPFILDLQNFLRADEDGQNSPGLHLKFVPRGWAKTYICNFLLLDDYGYRLEADRESPAAIAAFFSEEALVRDQPLKNIEEMFDRLWRVSTPLDPLRPD